MSGHPYDEFIKDMSYVFYSGLNIQRQTIYDNE